VTQPQLRTLPGPEFSIDSRTIGIDTKFLDIGFHPLNFSVLVSRLQADNMTETTTAEPLEHGLEAKDNADVGSSNLDSPEEEYSELDDLEDRRRPLRFIDDFPDLPLDTPDNHAHIVNTQGFDEEVNTSQAKAIDAAITLLYNYDPEVLKKFLDPRIERFTWRRHRKGPFQEVVVLRRKTLVQVSLP